MLAPAPHQDQAPPTYVPLDQYQRTCDEVTHWKERALTAEAQIEQGFAIIPALLTVLGNDKLTATDRIIGIKTALAREHWTANRDGDEAPFSIGHIANESGVSRSRVTAFRKKMKPTEIFTLRTEKAYTPPPPDAKPGTRGKHRTHLYIQPSEGQNAVQTLQQLATLDIGRYKPGGSEEQRAARAEELGKVPKKCPHCGSAHLTIRCDECHKDVPPIVDGDGKNEPTQGTRQNGAHEQTEPTGTATATVSARGMLQNGAQGLHRPPINHLPPIGEDVCSKMEHATGATVPAVFEAFKTVGQCADFAAAARIYAAADWAVFPIHTPDVYGGCSCGNEKCRDAGKHPRTAMGVYSATTDLDALDRWGHQWPTANIGWAVPAGTIVIDVDPEGMEPYQRIAVETGLPPTLTARSGGGGLHLPYRLPPGIVHGNKTGTLPPGIHIRGEGGYIVLAPSLHESGQLYTWTDVRPIAELPVAFLERIQPRPAQTPPPTLRTALPNGQRPPVYTTGRSIAEGGRNEALFKVACGMAGKGYLGDELAALVAQTNLNRCCPPLDADEVAKVTRSAEQQARRSTSTLDA